MRETCQWLCQQHEAIGSFEITLGIVTLLMGGCAFVWLRWIEGRVRLLESKSYQSKNTS